MSAATYLAMPLRNLAVVAADDLNHFCGNRQQPVDSVKALVFTLEAAAHPLTPPSAVQPVHDALRLTAREGEHMPLEAVRSYAGFLAEQLNLAIKAQPPRENYAFLTERCLRLSEASEKVDQRMATTLSPMRFSATSAARP